MARKKKNTDDVRVQIATALSDADLAAYIMETPNWENTIKEIANTGKKVVYPTDPVEFMTKTLGYAMWDKLEMVCKSVNNNHNTVVASSFGVGKSIVAAALACWFITTHDPAMVVTIAPTWAQVSDVIWRYIRDVGRRANLPGTIFETPRWDISPVRFATGISPRKTTETDMASLQGRHSPNLLVIMDEAAGLPPLLYDTVAGLAVGEGSRVLAIGNPIAQEGPFWRAFNSNTWNAISISAFDHPNVKEGRDVIPGAVSRQWIEQRCEEWATQCEPHAMGATHISWNDTWWTPMHIFESKVLGQFPQSAEDAFIPLSWVINAENNDDIIPDTNAIISCDPAPRAGDDTAIILRHGNHVNWIKRRKTPTTGVIVNWVQNVAKEHDATRVYIEETGPGIGVVDAARKAGLSIVAVNGGRSAHQKKRFANLRTEYWWTVRELLREGKIHLPRDTRLEADLAAPRTDEDESGRIKIEPKEKLTARLGRSVDSADALVISYSTGIGGSVDIDNLQSTLASNEKGTQVASSRWKISTRKSRGSRWRK